MPCADSRMTVLAPLPPRVLPTRSSISSTASDVSGWPLRSPDCARPFSSAGATGDQISAQSGTQSGRGRSPDEACPGALGRQGLLLGAAGRKVMMTLYLVGAGWRGETHFGDVCRVCELKEEVVELPSFCLWCANHPHGGFQDTGWVWTKQWIPLCSG